jgi:hypothetical protein
MMLRYWLGLALCAMVGGCDVRLKGLPINGDGGVDCSNGPNYTGCSCKPGDVRACYTGPESTAGVGSCKGGTQTCVATSELNYVFGDCEGQVLPSSSDSCGLSLDGGATNDAAVIPCTSDADCPTSAIVADRYTCAYSETGGCAAPGQCVHVEGAASCASNSNPPLVCTCSGQTRSLASLFCGIEPQGFVTTPIPSPTSGACPGSDGGI